MSKTLAQIAYEAFSSDIIGEFDEWGRVGSVYTSAWEASAQAVREAVIEECAALADSVQRTCYEQAYAGGGDSLNSHRFDMAHGACTVGHSIRSLLDTSMQSIEEQRSCDEVEAAS